VPAAEAARRGIFLASIQIALGRDYFRDTALPRVEFYRQLPREPRLPTIVAPLSADFVAAHREAAQQGENVLCLINPFESCSTYTAAYSAALAVKKENLTVEVMNTGRALTALGATCLATAELAAHGAGLPDVISAIEEATAQTDSLYAPATVEYLLARAAVAEHDQRAGRARRADLCRRRKTGHRREQRAFTLSKRRRYGDLYHLARSLCRDAQHLQQRRGERAHGRLSV
jgi:fatty acid-binding protein DegV